MDKKFVVWRGCGCFYFTNMANYRRYIWNQREIHTFNEADGFVCLEQVLSAIRNFGISEDDIFIEGGCE